jgi:hypothetical protein
MNSTYSYAFALLLHDVGDKKRIDHAVKCVTASRPDSGVVAHEMECERMDARSFPRFVALVDNFMLRERPTHTFTEYVHFMRQSFDDYNETCEMALPLSIIIT